MRLNARKGRSTTHCLLSLPMLPDTHGLALQAVRPWITLPVALGLPTVPHPPTPAAQVALQSTHLPLVSPPPTLEGPWPVTTAGEAHSTTPSLRLLVNCTRQVWRLKRILPCMHGGCTLGLAYPQLM